MDGTVRIWDMSLVERNGILRGHESYVYDVAFSPNGEQVASARGTAPHVSGTPRPDVKPVCGNTSKR